MRDSSSERLVQSVVNLEGLTGLVFIYLVSVRIVGGRSEAMCLLRGASNKVIRPFENHLNIFFNLKNSRKLQPVEWSFTRVKHDIFHSK